MDNNIDLSIIIPAYNEQAKILQTVTGIANKMFAMGIRYEILVIDDGSKDNTAFLVESLMARDISVHKQKENKGKGAAIRAGIYLSMGKYIAFIDADGQIDPEHISIFYKKITSLGGFYDGVIGNKYHNDSRVDYTWKRWVISKTYKAIVRILFRFDIPDTQFGCKLFRADILKQIVPDLSINRFAFDIEILANIKKAKKEAWVESLPVKLGAPRGQGSPSIKSILNMIKDTLKVWINYKFRRV